MKASVLTIGNFDGIHLGHRRLLERMKEIASAEDLRTVVLSYTDHPAFVLKKHAMPKLLCPAALKKRELMALGVDDVELLNFTSEFALISAKNFLIDTIVPVWHPKVILMGYDSHFGYQRQGDYRLLCEYAEALNYRVEYIDPLLHNGVPISSSMIRELLSQGDIQLANQLLGRPYRLTGCVGHGLGKGRDFGFPTANLILTNPHQLIPKGGIYFSCVYLGGEEYYGLTNIGLSPTVKSTGTVEIETYVIDFEGDVYCQQIELELLRYLREEKMFNSIDDLVLAMRKDLSIARQYISGELS